MVYTEIAKGLLGVQNIHFQQDRLVEIKIPEELPKVKPREIQK